MRSTIKTILAVALSVFLIGGTIQVFAQPEDYQDTGMNDQRLTIQEAGTYFLTGSMHGTVYWTPAQAM